MAENEIKDMTINDNEMKELANLNVDRFANQTKGLFDNIKSNFFRTHTMNEDDKNAIEAFYSYLISEFISILNSAFSEAFDKIEEAKKENKEENKEANIEG